MVSLGISSLLEMGGGSRLGEKKEDDRTWQKNIWGNGRARAGRGLAV